MKDYICKKALAYDKIDDDGSYTGKYASIEVGERFQSSDDKFRIAGGPNTVRLDSDGGTWLEITLDTLKEHFEEVEEGAYEH